MSSKKRAAIEHSAVNLVALQNLRVIRRRINDDRWKAAAERKLQRSSTTARKSTRKSSKDEPMKQSEYENILKMTIHRLVDEYAEKGRIPKGWNPSSGEPLPEFPNTREMFAAATDIDDGHLRALEEGLVQFTLDDAIQIARVGDMDLATFLTPSLEDLEGETFFNLRPPSKRFPSTYMFDWLMWIRGYRHLPGQNRHRFIEQTGSPSLKMHKLDDTRGYRGHDAVDSEKKLMESSKVFIGHLVDELSKNNPFKAPLTPFESSPPTVKSLAGANLALIQMTLALATQMKHLFTREYHGSLKAKRRRFVNLIEFIRYCISGIVRILMKLPQK